MTFTIELYTQGTSKPVAVMRGCRQISECRPPREPVMYQDGITFGGFLDAEGKKVSFVGLSAIIMEEAE